MSDNLNQIVDASGIERKLGALISRKQRDIVFKGILAGAVALQKFTRESLLAKWPKAKSAKGKSKHTAEEEIHIVKDKQINEVMVSVLNYLSKWYETGTQSRYLQENHPKDEKHHKTYKKGEGRGAIKPLWYFREARQQHADDVLDIIKDSILNDLKNEFDNA